MSRLPWKSAAVALLGEFAVVAAVLYMVGLAAGPSWLRLLAKPIPVLCLCVAVAWGATGLARSLVAVGLGLSALGDLLIEGSFLAGLATFLVAHIAYTAAFLADTRALRLGRLIPFALWGAGVLAFLQPRLGSMVAPVAVYVIVICAMMWRAAARVGERPQAWRGLAGAVLFAASDMLIALDRFHAPIPGVGYPIILLYWAGQTGIALSIRTPRA